MKAPRYKTRHSARPGSKLLLTLLILLVLLCGFLLGIVSSRAISWFGGQSSSVPQSPSVSSGVQPAPDLVLLQLIERVNESAKFMSSTITIISVMAALLAMVLGLRIWEVGKYAMRLLDQQFLEFQDEHLTPLVEDSRAELEGLRNEGLLLILNASGILIDDLFQEFKAMYEGLLEQQGVTNQTQDELPRGKEESFRMSRDITLYLIASLSRDEAVVLDACHKLSALFGRGIPLPKADLILKHMRGLLTNWGPRTEARTEIVRLVDEIERITRTSNTVPTSVAESVPSLPDDLKRIKGISPKISDVLQSAGIVTLAQLAATDVGRLERIVKDGGISTADPSTWPEQATLAAAGDWKALESLQSELKGARKV